MKISYFSFVIFFFILLVNCGKSNAAKLSPNHVDFIKIQNEGTSRKLDACFNPCTNVPIEDVVQSERPTFDCQKYQLLNATSRSALNILYRIKNVCNGLHLSYNLTSKKIVFEKPNDANKYQLWSMIQIGDFLYILRNNASLTVLKSDFRGLVWLNTSNGDDFEKWTVSSTSIDNLNDILFGTKDIYKDIGPLVLRSSGHVLESNYKGNVTLSPPSSSRFQKWIINQQDGFFYNHKFGYEIEFGCCI